METDNLNQNNQSELDKSYEDYLDTVIAEGDEDIRQGKIYSYADVRKEIIEKNFKK
jgi:hypothetical protein